MQGRFPPVGARHQINHKITFFLWNLRVVGRTLPNPHTLNPSAALLSRTIVSALSFPPPLLPPILVSPPFPTLGFLPSDSPSPAGQGHRRQPQHIPLPACSLQLGHTHAEQTPPALPTGLQVVLIHQPRLWGLRVQQLCTAGSGMQRMREGFQAPLGNLKRWQENTFYWEDTHTVYLRVSR